MVQVLKKINSYRSTLQYTAIWHVMQIFALQRDAL